ncbi:MAG: aldo/keto reductase [Oscillospiraceae bacterium]|nr:aldo/keto reductase [Oscillospiraceae bacterium]
MISVKKLGFGMMRLPLLNPDRPTSIDLEQTKQMVDTFLERGYTYFDTAWMYHSFQSEKAAKEVLVDRHPRESYTLATKLHAGYIQTAQDCDKIFEQQCEKCGVDYFDYYLLHDIGQNHYEVYTRLNCFEWLQEKKKQGKVKHIGFSFHDNADLLDKVLSEHPEMDFVQLQINYLDWENPAIQSRLCYEVACKHNVPVIVMEPAKGGMLANVPQEVTEMFAACHPDWSVPSWAIRFAAGLENVALVLSGMSNMEQLLDNTGYMTEACPLGQQEQDLLQKAIERINADIAIPCTGCAYCVDGCPMNIPIPRYFSLYNDDKKLRKGRKWTLQEGYYDRLAMVFGKAGDCIGCGQCEGTCPQHLPIVEHLKTISKIWDR